MALRDVALTVLELEPNEFHWVLMEAVQADSEECLGYRPIDSSTQGLPDYSEALIQGASALRVLQGLAPFGRPKAPVGLGETTLTGPVAALRAPAPPEDEDSCLFTTDRSSL
ncbi:MULTISPECIES: hypothetical protein [unclassified Variovorax]|uniref:hypothetical protein n=1 Tax=unclassified Variovorax TaxID=663243 RepID=UPI001315E2DA|nr:MULTISPECIES: hypothetical protein [unclassified Variovorax]VTU21610.1 hypothetical protein SRS16CHR_02879 [Variovorax sp. SRS16]VTU29545.1 hypothetical protein E5CHR_02833 [Variovorax sp. PBL-E5]